MFLLLSVFAASIDGFVSGILASGMGIKMDVKNSMKVFSIVFICCIAVSLPGGLVNFSYLEQYINVLGIIIMLYLSINCLFPAEGNQQHSGVSSIALYTALDASIVCIYLSIDGYNPVIISTLAAVLHSLLMSAGAKLTGLIIKNKREMYTKYISCRIFILMALYKTNEVL